MLSNPRCLGFSSDPSEKLRCRRSYGTVGLVGEPSFVQPCASAVSWQRRQTSTNSLPPFGEKRIVRSPISSVRSQIAHVCKSVDRVTRVIELRG